MAEAGDPSAQVRRLAGWTPFFLEQKPDEPQVHWLEVGQAGFPEPFFERTIRRRLAAPECRVAMTRIRALELLPLVAPCLAPSGFIFHSSRAGSTLLANALKALPVHLVISEPGPVNQLLSWPDHRREPALWRHRFQGLLACLGQPVAAGQRHYFVKFASHNLLEISWILEAFPAVPWVFLYREPRAVLASALARPPRWMRLRDRPETAARELGLAPEEIAGLSQADYGALVLARFYRRALAAAERGGLLVNYTQLTPAHLAPLCRHFGFTPDGGQLAAMADAFAYDAKAASPQAFAPRPTAPPDPAVELACTGALDELYAKLEARRAFLPE